MTQVGRTPLRHGLAPIAQPGCRVLILGSFPGELSLAHAQYYAHQRNAFWRIMESLLGLPEGLEYRQREQALAAHGIALWDVLGACVRRGSLDSAIRDAHPNPIAALLARHRSIRTVAFNGSAAAALYARAVEPVLPADLARPTYLRLPSTSPANARLSLQDKLALWSSQLQPHLDMATVSAPRDRPSAGTRRA